MPVGPAHRTQRPGPPAPGLALTRREHLRLADVLLRAAGNRTPIAPLSTSYPEMTAEDAARIRDSGIVRRIASGARIVGAKVSLGQASAIEPAPAPRLGWLTSEMLLSTPVLDLGELIRPRAEAKVAFVLADRLRSRLHRNADLLALADRVVPCLEVVDVRYQAFDVDLVDDIADNCAASRLLTGERIATPTEEALVGLQVRLASTAESSAVAHAAPLLRGLIWLANRVIDEDGELEAGALLLSSACCPAVPLRPGDRVSADFGPLGSLELLTRTGVST
jgi:2-keto-4-pentenoate hydratase